MRFLTLVAFLSTFLSAGDFLPLAPGNSWTYRDASTGSTFQVDVAATQIFVGGQVHHVLRGFGTEPLWVRADPRGNLFYWNADREADQLLLSFEPVPNGWFQTGRRNCDSEGQVQEARSEHQGPAGHWSTVEIHYRTFACADAGELSEQYAENIGLVRRVVNTIAGPRTFDLVYARVGSQSISARPTGSFTTSAVLNPGGGAWTATLRLEEFGVGNGIKVRFPSSQEYDLRLRGSDGQVLWTWSSNRLFLAALHERTIQGAWTETVEVPVPPGVPEIRRVFTLEAWLTPASGEPQFAAATTIDVPGIAPAFSVGGARGRR